MDNSEVINSINEFSSLVYNKYSCVDIILFGSYAKGTFHKESDIDIAVILEDFDNSTNIQLELMRIRRKIDSRIEPHPFRLADFNTTNPLVNEIVKYGKRIENSDIANNEVIN